MKTKSTYLFLSCILSLSLKAQQIPSLSLFMENTYLINPAAAGSNQASPISLHYKRWWSGFNESPTMQAITGHTPISGNVGLGAKFFNYSTGPISKLGIEGTYSYHFKVGSSSKIALGLSAQLYQFYLNKNLLKLEEDNDQAIIYSSDKIISPDAAFGAYFYDDNYFAGISVYQLINRKVHLMNNDNLENRQVRHYFLTGGYRFDINENFSLEPSVLVKFIETGIGQLDINVKSLIKQFLWYGISYRTSEAISVNLGIKKSPIIFGYSYDILLSDIRKHSVGSHELLFIYQFNKSKTKIYSE
jgi:type IX secretion system PorP/SprF family membrane protein